MYEQFILHFHDQNGICNENYHFGLKMIAKSGVEKLVLANNVNFDHGSN